MSLNQLSLLCLLQTFRRPRKQTDTPADMPLGFVVLGLKAGSDRTIIGLLGHFSSSWKSERPSDIAHQNRMRSGQPCLLACMLLPSEVFNRGLVTRVLSVRGPDSGPEFANPRNFR